MHCSAHLLCAGEKILEVNTCSKRVTVQFSLSYVYIAGCANAQFRIGFLRPILWIAQLLIKSYII